jgi:DNA repair exonuclease SbcCD ATPase subunit
MAKIRVLSWLTEDNLGKVADREEEMKALFDPHLIGLMTNHLRLIQLYDEFASSTGFAEATRSADIELVLQGLRKNTLELCRLLTRDPTIVPQLREIIGDHGESRVSHFLAVGGDLKRLCLAKFTTPIEEEQSRERELLEVEEKLRKAKEEENNWEKSLNLLRRERERAKESRAKEMNELKTMLADVKTKTDNELKKINENTEDRNKQLEQQVGLQLQERKERHDRLSKELEELKKLNADKEVALRKNRQKAIVKLTDLMVGYDKDMADKTDTLTRRNEKYQLEKTRLDALEKRYKQLEYEKKRLADEERKEQARREIEEKAILQRDLASEYIQAHWKGYVSRQDYTKLYKKWKKKRR